jgi:hypothetical protein
MGRAVIFFQIAFSRGEKPVLQGDWRFPQRFLDGFLWLICGELRGFSWL